ncbi:hypothetical protein COCON_G00195280 [Conger conger]|uniref:PDZ domain-containing protein n=1 Tax=Conger conger TaxID=82655 RepID=A0A9Q1HQQ6_CONCO|nr:hypothetical protein COCON_G00195280 [Conger conger]
MAVYEEQEAQQRVMVSPGRSSPDPDVSELSVFHPNRGGRIEVNSSALKSSTPLLVSSSSDSALDPQFGMDPPQPEHLNGSLSRTGGTQDRTGSDAAPAKMSQTSLRLTQTVEISGERGPLGIHVVPYCSSLSGRSLGLHIRSVEENSRSKKEGIFHEDDCIVKINDTELMDKSFAQSQEVFRQAMRSPTMRLQVVPVLNRDRYEKSLIGQLYPLERPEDMPLPLNAESFSRPKETQSRVEGPSPAPLSVPIPAPNSDPPAPGSTPLPAPGPAPLSAPGSTPLPPPPKEKSPSSLLKHSPALPFPPVGGVASKKGARKVKVELRKGPEGLGFTVVTRDASVHGPGPILVKNILPRGAAVKDGRLKSGDRILEVNEVDFSGRTQEQLVAMLRSTKQGETVSLLVSRQEEIFPPRELPLFLPCLSQKGEQTDVRSSEDRRQMLRLEIPLNDSGSAGLGLSLKGNQSRETGADLGIFIKSIIHGGAAYKDGRLCVNDQLIAVNGESLLEKSNRVAMETLRRSMSMEGNARGRIQLVLLRGPSWLSLTPPKPASDVSLSQLRLTDIPACPAQTSTGSSQCERSRVPFGITNGHRGNLHEQDGYEEDLPPLPPDPQHRPIRQRAELGQGPHRGAPSLPRQSELPHAQASRSVDLGKPHNVRETTTGT